jgi:hypothetical protein
MLTIVIRAAAGAVIAANVMFCADAIAANKSAPAARQFLAQVTNNFDAWDLDHDGRLTRAEIERDMQDATIKGDAAAALAALKWDVMDTKPGEPPKSYARADFEAMQSQLAGGKGFKLPYLAHFTNGLKKLGETPRQLFAEEIPHLTSIRQDSTSDCYFNSAVGSVAQASPKAIVKLIKQNADGTFTVTFPGKASDRIPAPTDAEIAAYSDAADGIWFNVLEKAYAKIRPIDPKAATSEPIDAAALIGGSENDVLGLISGHKIKATHFPLISRRTLDERLLKNVRAELIEAFQNHRAVVTAKYHHAFAVVAYDPRTDTVTIHNPYDGNGSEGLPNGDNPISSIGFVSLSTEQFVENFKGMGVEQKS